ncbi:NAD(P)H-dependent flavin oxidoreductase YrpB (nitropropane dioxygenase family) [Streptosporangium becharense]|uniref:NAD(P)H-dependent flavin oxidoreductase YrpB (Nitropropane dioxygenase family) n=1 Tax=Streptosporangium becharense TaxID=1816182 RepID=A0A7W9IEX4_9ACTN|nr:nitronate monooxygenase family protein [Streptosporangium becharense]MBB2909788.1 NAD(P)H-dependent flavin oxidoreductase YrpB (nitropropane dioxygenase family) [Streptosporangium becharense]MBB5819256.1 NAD(P)H-dependent flavin oxidoreductase YrpB (nitropropane dioxygenase family) [Streptosporangium becharense]
MRTRVTDMLGIEFPIFAFSHCRDVVAAVSRAGGMGVLGALYFSPEELETELKWIDDHVDGRPYGVDVVMPASYAGADLDVDSPEDLVQRLQGMIPEGHRRFVEDLLAGHGVPPLSGDGDAGKVLLGWTDATARPQVEVALRHPIALLANALGPPPADVVEAAHAKGVKVAALASTPRHATKQVEVGVDIVVAQGTEAGGHTGEISTMVLVPQVVDAVDVPVLAAGGIGDGRQMAAGLALGAEGVWTGSIWLAVEEADTPVLARERILRATSRDTVRSRSWTGKPARLLRNEWTDAWESSESPGTLPMPLQFMLVSEALRRIGRSDAAELATFPAGQIIGAVKRVRATRDVMFDLVEQYVEAKERLDRITGA